MRSSITFVFILAFVSVGRAAETPEQIFKQESPSVVVVHVSNAQGKVLALGSGVVIRRGVVVTNCHVAQDGPQLRVSHLGKTFAASLRYADADRDLCELSVPNLSAPAVSLASTTNLQVGQRVYAIGAPEGLELTLSEGLISSLRSIGGLEFIQTTASISPGSSGGGLFDEHGRLIGITTFYFKDGQNLNFALPSDWIAGLPARARAQASAEGRVRKNRTDWILQAGALEEKSDWQGLLKLSQRWTVDEPKESGAWGTLGEAYGNLGRYRDAAVALHKSLRLNPDEDMAWVDLGTVYGRLGQYEDDINAEKQAIRLNPNEELAWVDLGIAFGKLGEYEKELMALEEAVRLNPNEELAWVNLGVAYLGLGQRNKELHAEQEAIRLRPDDEYAWFDLAGAYHDLGQYDKSVSAYQEAIRQKPADEEAWVQLGVAFWGLGQYDKEIDAEQEAIRLKPGDAIAWFHLGRAYSALGQRSQVINVYERLKPLNKTLADAFFRTAVLP